MDVKIRFAVPADIDTIVQLCEEHAAFEQAEYDPIGKTQKLHKSMFSTPQELYCLLVEIDNNVIGFATYMKQFSTWDAESYVYMDCLFLQEKGRSKGIGQKLVLRIAEEAKALKCSFLQWQTPSFNERAINFYKKIGAVSKSKERFFLAIK